jgi:pimeloyl-ACP methyl ester carboxylesterase
MTTYLIHGFNIRDGGRKTVGRLAPYLTGDIELFDCGWTFVFGLAATNRAAIDQLLQKIKPGDSIVAHSNGCLIAWEITQRIGDNLDSVVCINPALRRDTLWPPAVRVLCISNHTDWVVQLGRWWGRLYPIDGVACQGWGAAGRYGFTAHQGSVDNWDSAEWYWEKPVTGHSGLFRQSAVGYWGSLINIWRRAQER